MKVPFLDLKAQYNSIREEINDAIQKVLDSCAFAGGPFVEEFEENFAEFCQTRYAIAVGSGTSALWMALLALDIGAGDEVITAANTFIATAEAISYTGAKPVFVDVDAQTYNMNPELLEAAITLQTKAIIPVHLYGQMADMGQVMEIAERYNLHVIEDASQAHGAEYKSLRAGSIGDLGCFSFYPGKNLGAYGEAGCVVTNRNRLAEVIRKLRDHGQSKKYHHDLVGWNARMDGVQGAVLNVKLKYLNEWNEARRKNANLYNELLREIDSVITPQEADFRKHVYHIYAIRTRDRNDLIKELAEKEIFCGIHYPIPVHLTDAYQYLEYQKNSFPVAEELAEDLISLPMFAELQREHIEIIADEIKNFLKFKYPSSVNFVPANRM
jgi:dTDP-4-amino-4,6-dideoxygalactose transaminase